VVPQLVSVVIPTLNYAAYVGRAIDSALGQTYPHTDVIVVDDGSTDDTPAVLARYGDRIRVVAGAGAGVSAARNRGLAAARGDLIAVLDADDEWLPTKLARQLPVLAEAGDVGVVGCANTVWRGDGTHLATRFYPNPPDDPVVRMRKQRRMAAFARDVSSRLPGVFARSTTGDDQRAAPFAEQAED